MLDTENKIVHTEGYIPAPIIVRMRQTININVCLLYICICIHTHKISVVINMMEKSGNMRIEKSLE